VPKPSHQNRPEVVITIPDDLPPKRLDSYLASRDDLNLTRSRIQKLFESGLITLDGQPVLKKHRVKGGETIILAIPPVVKTDLKGEPIPLDIVHEDEHLVVVNKPAGMVTHPAVGNHSGTLVNALVHHLGSLPQSSGADRPGIVHRLDKDTSGLLVVARTDTVLSALQKAVQERRVTRSYSALVCGHVKEEAGTIDLPIGRSLKNRKRMTVTHVNSRESVTDYKLQDRFRSYDLLEVNLHTGRTHQIRVHFSHVGHPVFGDPDYGGRQKWHRGIFAPERLLAKKLLEILPRQALHAARLKFTHPVTGDLLDLHRDPPEDYQDLLDVLDEEGR